MRVFVAGATGAIGKPLLRHLITAGHEVTGLTRHDAKRSMLERAPGLQWRTCSTGTPSGESSARHGRRG